MKTLIAILASFMISTNVFAGAFSGTYKTMPSKKSGGWAHVKFGACKENKHLTCGTLIKAFSKDGKVYNSKMEILTKNKIGVSGCVLFICQAQEWIKIK